MPLTIPNLLTLARIVMIPMIVGVFYLPESWLTVDEKNLVATCLFVGAALTDAIDGWVARAYNQSSPFGAFLDPVADKLMVCAALLVLLDLGRVGPGIALVIVGREITISALREWMATMGSRKSVAVHGIGKLKTIAQMVAIPMLLFNAHIGPMDMRLLGDWLIQLATALTVISMLYYIKQAWPSLSGQDL